VSPQSRQSSPTSTTYTSCNSYGCLNYILCSHPCKQSLNSSQEPPDTTIHTVSETNPSQPPNTIINQLLGTYPSVPLRLILLVIKYHLLQAHMKTTTPAPHFQHRIQIAIRNLGVYVVKTENYRGTTTLFTSTFSS